MSGRSNGLRRWPALILAAAWALPQAAAEPRSDPPGAPKPAYCLAAD